MTVIEDSDIANDPIIGVSTRWVCEPVNQFGETRIAYKAPAAIGKRIKL